MNTIQQNAPEGPAGEPNGHDEDGGDEDDEGEENHKSKSSDP